MDIKHASILLTGGGSGLGAATARRVVAQGGRITLADVNIAAGEQLAKELGGAAMFSRCDVTSSESVRSAIDQSIAHFGPLTGVVCCAGILGASRVVGRDGPHDLELFRKVIEVNLIGTFNVLRLAAAAMASNEPNDQGERGVAVTTASVAAFEGQIGQAAYAASKGGVASLTLPLARELGKLGIRIVSIAPGVFETPMMQAAPAAVRDSLASQIPFPSRFGRGDEFAALVCHIFENSYLNGETIRLDGAIRMSAK